VNLGNIQRRIKEIKAELSGLGPMHPGSISKQYNICGNPNCRCKDPENPQKHGPYYQLSYSWRGKSSSLFVKKDRLEGMRGQVANYKRLRALTQEWVDLEMKRERIERTGKE
jgi:hypothetical protein